MSTDEGFRIRNGTDRPTDAEAEAGVAMEDSRPQTPEDETQLDISTTTVATVAMGFLNPRKRKHIGVVQSLKAIAMSSCVFLISPRGRTCSSDDLFASSSY